MADDKRVAQDFAEASRNLSRVTSELKDFNMSAGKDIAMTAAGEFKKVTDPFVQSFQSLPGVATLGAAGKSLFNKSFQILKDKREQALLRERLGLTREQFGQLKKQKAVVDAQEKYAEELKGASENLLGIDVERFNIAAGRFTDESGAFIGGVDKMIGLQQDMIDADEKARANEMRGAAKRVEKDNEKMRKEQETQSIFHSIAAGIDNLAAGVANIKAEDVGMGLLAPIGLIGSIIVSFVGAFVAEVKRQFDGLKILVSTFGRLFRPIKDAITSAGKSMFGNTLISAFFNTIKNGFTRIGSFLGGITKFIGESKTVEVIGNVVRRIRTALTTLGKPFIQMGETIGKSVKAVTALSAEGGMISKILGFAKGFGSVLGKLFLPVTIVMSAFDLITGFIDGFKESEGNNIVSKFIDGVGGGLSKLIGNLIGIPLDLLKSGVSWIMGAMGFDKAEEFLDSFSFADLIMDIVKAPFTLVSKAVSYIKGLFTGENDLFADIGSMFGNIADAAKDLLKSILRAVLPNPAGESDGIFGFIKKAVSAVIPDGVYEFAGLDPKTGEVIPEPPAPLEESTGEGSNKYDRIKSRMDRKRERLAQNQAENDEAKGNQTAQTIVQNIQTNDNSTNNSQSTVTTQPIRDTAAPAGTVPALM